MVDKTKLSPGAGWMETFLIIVTLTKLKERQKSPTYRENKKIPRKSNRSPQNRCLPPFLKESPKDQGSRRTNNETSALDMRSTECEGKGEHSVRLTLCIIELPSWLWLWCTDKPIHSFSRGSVLKIDEIVENRRMATDSWMRREDGKVDRIGRDGELEKVQWNQSDWSMLQSLSMGI